MAIAVHAPIVAGSLCARTALKTAVRDDPRIPAATTATAVAPMDIATATKRLRMANPVAVRLTSIGSLRRLQKELLVASGSPPRALRGRVRSTRSEGAARQSWYDVPGERMQVFTSAKLGPASTLRLRLSSLGYAACPARVPLGGDGYARNLSTDAGRARTVPGARGRRYGGSSNSTGRSSRRFDAHFDADTAGTEKARKAGRSIGTGGLRRG